jgi:hypothetical protein
LLLKKDKELFVEWLKEEVGASTQHATGLILIFSLKIWDLASTGT